MKSERIAGVDVARALASLIMIQGHAYHAWVAPEHRESSYAFTRFLGTFPLPSFLLLAGAAVALRSKAADRKGESRNALRAALAKRGLWLVGVGYAVNFAFALIDGSEGPETLFRSDVLHVIGWSLMLASVAIPPAGSLSRAIPRSLALALALALLCPWVSDLAFSEWLRPFAAPFVDAAPYTRMPLVPIGAWLLLGLALSLWLFRREAEEPFAKVAGAPPRLLLLLLLGSAALAWGASSSIAFFELPLSRRHPSVWLNLLDLGGRAVALLCLGALLAPMLNERARQILIWIGQGSLVTYVVHIPFCYGAFGRSIYRSLDMRMATLWLVPLMGLSIACVFAKRRIDFWRKRSQR